ncbi:MAG TPA: hypothetical protein VFI47_08855 [Acidimicrobiales bacterium]|nr:hypothetical protein [Acidimicrobiales bacterium]
MHAPGARFDPLRGRWVIVAPARAQRPAEPGTGGRAPPGCAFCAGHEDRTPPEVARAGPGPPDEPGWRVRVFPNRFPVVAGGPAASSGDGDRDRGGDDPLRRGSPARGRHEVVVLSPDHHRSLGSLDEAAVVEVLTVVRDRARAHAAEGLAYSQAFVNHGPAAGASLEHPHAQIVAAGVPPSVLLEEAARISPGGRCTICAEIDRLGDDPELLVAGGDAVLWCPWWAGSDYEMLLAPRRHRPRFEDAGAELGAVAAVLGDGLRRVDVALGGPPYNLAVHSRPAGVGTDGHWHVHIWPRLQREAGFERATGVLIATVDPAGAAQVLRAAGTALPSQPAP